MPTAGVVDNLPARPSYAPIIRDAPGLNWVGPGDAWSRAWGVTAQQPYRAPILPAPVPPVPLPPGAGTFGAAADPGSAGAGSGIPAMPSAPPPLLLPNAAVAVLPLARRAQGGAPAGPTAEDIALVRRSLGVLESVADRATAHFYAVLFLRYPDLRALFPAAMDLQRDRLFRALLVAGRAADDPAALTEYLDRLARGHRKYGVRNEHYGPVGEALLAALERYCGRYWDPETEIAWRRIYRAISEVMMASADADAQVAPASWQAEVVAVDRRAGEVAVVTLRTDQRYPYLAGQYTTLEVPLWPRVWRHYSPAGAPRDDGLVTLHVKAVPAGWVSNALVHRTNPGDVLRLGPAAGTMHVDHDGDAPLLLIGGGTGIAPIIAMVEAVAEHGRARTVEVFYGARRDQELYAREELEDLARRHPWLAVRTAVSEGRPDGAGFSGSLPAVVDRYGPWDEYEAFVSGPPAMIRRTAAMLREEGVQGTRIHHDLSDPV